MAYYQWKDHPYSSQKIRMRFVIVLTILFFGIGCSDRNNQPFVNFQSSTPNQTNIVNQQSATIKVAVIPAQSSPEQVKKIQELSEYLEKSLFRKFEIQIQKDYETAVELLVNEKVQIAYLGSFTYIQAKQKNPNVQPILAPITKATGRPWHTSIIIANAQKIKNIQDLNNKRFGFVSKSSTTGFLIPQIEFFQAQRINPQKTFTTIKFLGSHNQAIEALIAGEVDAVAVAQEAFIKAQLEKQLDTKKYIKIWESSPLPTDPIVVSTKLDPRLINGIKKALLDAPPGIIALSGAETVGYTIVDDINYERIRRIYQKLTNYQGNSMTTIRN